MFNFGNSADYLTRRIARDFPDILERMKSGEFKSVIIQSSIPGSHFRCENYHERKAEHETNHLEGREDDRDRNQN